MSKVIKGGTVVTADRSYAADVKIDKGFIVEIGQNLSGDALRWDLQEEPNWLLPKRPWRSSI